MSYALWIPASAGMTWAFAGMTWAFAGVMWAFAGMTRVAEMNPATVWDPCLLHSLLHDVDFDGAGGFVEGGLEGFAYLL